MTDWGAMKASWSGICRFRVCRGWSDADSIGDANVVRLVGLQGKGELDEWAGKTDVRP